MYNRRSVLKIGAFSILGARLNHVIAQEAEKDNKSVIFIWLGGGIAQTEWTIPCPNAPEDFQSYTGFIKTNIEGLILGGTFTNLANHGDKMNIIHSFSHRDSNHNSATHEILTGHESFTVLDGAPQKEPFYGSMVSYVKGANNVKDGLPTFVKVNKITYDNSAWLGAEHIGYDSSKGLEDLKLRMEKEKFLYRTKIVDEMEKANKVIGQEMAKNWSDLRKQAVNVIAGKASEAFEWEKESETIRLKYDAAKSTLGKNLLLARRLVERGTRFVSVSFDGWDMHTDLEAGFASRGKELDIQLANLIEDIYSRGMNKDCMIIVASEFGRTPKKNKTSGQFGTGRDHWPILSSLLFIGGDYPTGRIIGKCDKTSSEPINKPYYPHDLCATIFDHFGFKKDIQKIDMSGRPRYLSERGECIL